MATKLKCNEINDKAKLLSANLEFRANYHDFLHPDNPKKVLLVEGQTDERFIKDELCDDVICMAANMAFYDRSSFGQKKDSKPNWKNAIVNVVYGLSVIPKLIDCSNEFADWTVYGMIDLDFDDEGGTSRTHRLFITDTHDLETLMISTDDELLEKIDGCTITAMDAKKAIFMAYQLGRIREVIDKPALTAPLYAGKGEVEYSLFITNDYRVSIKDLIVYLNQKVSIKKTEKSMNKAQMEKFIDQLCKNKALKKHLTKDACWKSDITGFDIASTEDLWEVVNGHDILALIRYVNKEASIKFSNRNPELLNRQFEMELIKAYDHNNFRKTKICSNMVREEVVKQQ